MSKKEEKTVWLAQNKSSDQPCGITVNNTPFFASGVAYSPVPWGANPNWSPFGDFFFPPWNGIWERDLPLMRAAGINVIRSYNIENVNPNSGAKQDHTDFLKACWNKGEQPVYVLLGFGPLNNLAIYNPWKHNTANPSRDAVKTTFLAMVEAYKDFPAVMGFIIGNEVNNEDTRSNSDFWIWIDGLAQSTKTTAPDKLTVMALVDDSMISVGDGNAHVPHLDVWGINSYRGKITPATANNFDNLWTSYAAASDKPLLISEWGAPASTHTSTGALDFSSAVMSDLCTYITGHYSDIVFNNCASSSNAAVNPNSANWAAVCVGSCYFEWTDEWWKMDSAYPSETCAATKQDAGIAQNAAFPGAWDDEESFGLNAITPSGTHPNNRPGPTPGSCPGPWDFSANAPYPVDILTPRDSLTTLYAGNMTVESTSAWQKTGVSVSSASTVSVTYISGSWTANPNDSGGALYNAAGNADYVAKQPGYTMPGQNEGALIGRVASQPDQVFLIGNGPTAVPSGLSGELELCINDDLQGLYGPGLTDNIGSLTVYVGS